MRRREFMGACAAAAVASSLPVNAVSFANAEGTQAPFKLSVMLWTVYRDMPFEARLEKVAAAGYHAVELVGEFKDWTPAQFDAARRKKDELKIEFDATAGVWHTLADANDRDAFLKSLREFFPIMEKLECSKLILQSGNTVPGSSAEQMRANCIETLKRGGDLAAQNKIELLVENIDPEENPKYFLTSSAEGFEIVQSVGNPSVKLLYDLFHEQIAEGNLIAKLQKNIDKIGLIHIADVPGRHEPGTGEINYENVFRKLGELNYQRYAAMEFIPTGDPVENLRSAREMAVKFGQAGRSHASAGISNRGIHASA